MACTLDRGCDVFGTEGLVSFEKIELVKRFGARVGFRIHSRAGVIDIASRCGMHVPCVGRLPCCYSRSG